MERTIELTDPRALRAVAHPVRLELIGLLRREGPLTATEAGARIGESPASCSFHLRQLAKYGLVEEAGGGRGRQRPWRATALFTRWGETEGSPEAAAASEALDTVVAGVYFDRLRRWLAVRGDVPAEWREAAFAGDRVLYVTPEELAEVGRELDAVTERFVERVANPELRPEGSRAVALVQLAMPEG
jgi:DNA-binding transcriptional ArsR family regulator